GALKFIAENIKHAVYFDANQRYDKWEYPLRALEEVLNNALAHRDYFSNADIQLLIYDDRIEVWNPGELIKPLTPEDLKRKHRSIPRNKFLANRLFLIKYIEHWGMGTNRIVTEMRENGLPDPKFQNLSGGFDVTLHGPD
ncbi:ATP-binding protein, partial [Elusimicrobiota bacterium]